MKKFLRMTMRGLVFLTGTSLFVFVAVPVMEMVLLSCGSRAVLEGFVCFLFALRFGQKIYAPRRVRK